MTLFTYNNISYKSNGSRVCQLKPKRNLVYDCWSVIDGKVVVHTEYKEFCDGNMYGVQDAYEQYVARLVVE